MRGNLSWLHLTGVPTILRKSFGSVTKSTSYFLPDDMFRLDLMIARSVSFVTMDVVDSLTSFKPSWARMASLSKSRCFCTSVW
jgi:hypothetical protein